MSSDLRSPVQAVRAATVRVARRARDLLSDASMRMLLLGVAAGLVGGLAAGAFGGAQLALGWLLMGDVDLIGGEVPWWRLLVVPVGAGAAAGLLAGRLTRRGQPYGMASLIEAVQLPGDRLSLRDGLGTAAAAAVSLAGGHSGGREAPVAAMAAAVVGRLAERLGLRDGQARVLVAAAGAAAIAASFNTPLGSALLALELMLGSFALQHFGPVVAATITGTLVGQALLGERVAFHAPMFVLARPVELLAYAGLGVAGGLAAHGYTLAITSVGRQVDALRPPAIARGAAAGLAVGLFAALGLPQVMGPGYPLIARLVEAPEQLGLGLLVLLLLAKVAATAATAAGHTGPGLFSPVLVVGALTGSVFGLAFDAVMPGTFGTPGSFALVGMGAVAAAVLRAPIAMTLVLFELTGTWSIVPAMGLTVAVAAIVSAALDPRSLYERLLDARGVRLHRSAPDRLRARRVGDLMVTHDLPTVSTDGSLQDYVGAFHGTRSELVWVLDAQDHYRGAVDVQDVLDALSGALGSDGTELVRLVPALHAEDSGADALTLLAGLDVPEAPVVDATGHLIGVVSERVLLDAVGSPSA